MNELVISLAIGVLTGVLYVLIALGLTLIYGILHIVNFAHGEIYMLGAMAVFYAYAVAGVPLLPTFGAIVVLAALAGLAIERGIFRSLRGQWQVGWRYRPGGLAVVRQGRVQVVELVVGLLGVV